MTVTDSGTAGHAQGRMRVRKRNGDTEPVDLNKVVRAVERCIGDPGGGGLDEVDPLRVATRTISGLYDGAPTAELDRLSIQTSSCAASRRTRRGRSSTRTRCPACATCGVRRSTPPTGRRRPRAGSCARCRRATCTAR